MNYKITNNISTGLFFTEKSCFYKIVVEGPNGEYRKPVRIRDVRLPSLFTQFKSLKDKICLRLVWSTNGFCLFVIGYERHFNHIKCWKWRKYRDVVYYLMCIVHTHQRTTFSKRNEIVHTFSFYSRKNISLLSNKKRLRHKYFVSPNNIIKADQQLSWRHPT